MPLLLVITCMDAHAKHVAMLFLGRPFEGSPNKYPALQYPIVCL